MLRLYFVGEQGHLRLLGWCWWRGSSSKWKRAVTRLAGASREAEMGHYDWPIAALPTLHPCVVSGVVLLHLQASLTRFGRLT